MEMETITVDEVKHSFYLYNAEVGKFAAFATKKTDGHVAGICVEDTLEACKKAAQEERAHWEAQGEDWSDVDIDYYLIAE